MMLYLEIGNTNIKFKSETGRYCPLPSIKESLDIVADVVMSYTSVKVLSVVPELLELLMKETPEMEYKIINNESCFSFKHNLEGVGLDRLVAVEGALSLYQAPFIIVDLGTAVTIDYISCNTKPVLEGGAILPGYKLASKSLNQFTAALPEIETSCPISVIGTQTNTAINSGIAYSITDGIEGILDRICTKTKLVEPTLIVTGGGALLFSSIAKKKYHLVEELLFKGMEKL